MGKRYPTDEIPPGERTTHPRNRGTGMLPKLKLPSLMEKKYAYLIVASYILFQVLGFTQADCTTRTGYPECDQFDTTAGCYEPCAQTCCGGHYWNAVWAAIPKATWMPVQ